MEGNIRIYVSEADDAVRRLAQLDSQRPPTSQVLLAEVDGQPRAAKPLDGGRAFADPFHQTSDLVGLLELRIAQLQPVPERRLRLRLVAILSHAHRPARVPCKRQAVRRRGGSGRGAGRAADVGLGRRPAYARPGSERPSTWLAPGSKSRSAGWPESPTERARRT